MAEVKPHGLPGCALADVQVAFAVFAAYRFSTGELDRSKFEALCRMFDGYTKLIPLTFLLGFYVSNVVSRYAQD
ncbi:hypothetical protein ANCCAN_15843 [Ancylostoma caninum]|uniref:Bestrophin homolog n=1 Tax=Ancylostoma caninum TaxID=29170 RepID=A0A368G3I0_ANCCA|nr:hypothetical protein ANCCAN_15843 [Ancylostoma caninum]